MNADDIARGLSGFNVEGAAIAADRFGLVFLWLPSPEYVVARVAERVRRGGHNIPAETVRRRYFAGLRNFFELYQPIADSWLCLDNRAGFKTKPIAAGTQAARQSYRGMARRPRGLDPARRN
ncbi:MAG TPA: hypothetical protein VNH11_29260 [Pirellulales bacterium]|nr:hypothetical protein [Pirellulales bacterium]